jgi:uncharacterized protein YkwD
MPRVLAMSLAAVASVAALALPGAATAATTISLPVPCVKAEVVTIGTCSSTSAPATTACAGAGLEPSRTNVSAVRRATLCLLNAERSRRGLGALRSNPRLASAASSYARAMVAHSFFDHVSPGGSTLVKRITATHYLSNALSWSLGENLAWGSGVLATPEETVQAWMHSPGHRANILDRGFREIGIGVALGVPVRLSAGAAGATYATEFGRRSR